MDFQTFMTDSSALLGAMEARHSVRQYTDEPISDEVAASLEDALKTINEDHWTDLQLVRNEPKAFNSRMAKYGKFEGANNYIALVGPECKELREVLGYAGEKLVLYAQDLGLNTCWVGLTYKAVNRVYRVEIGNKLEGVIAIGYGQTPGKPRKSVAPEVVAAQYADAPDWFRAGVDAALLAPTAVNQQKFRFELTDKLSEGVPVVKARTKRGPFAKMDLGIAKLHFEIGAGPDSFEWA